MGLRGWQTFNDIKLVDRIATGLPISSADNIVRKLDPDGNFLHVFDFIPKATYYRRKDQKKPLTKDQSELVFALSKVFSETLRHYHNDSSSAALFLKRKHPILDNRSPFEVASESTAGADLVLKLLARAEAGVAI